MNIKIPVRLLQRNAGKPLFIKKITAEGIQLEPRLLIKFAKQHEQNDFPVFLVRYNKNAWKQSVCRSHKDTSRMSLLIYFLRASDSSMYTLFLQLHYASTFLLVISIRG